MIAFKPKGSGTSSAPTSTTRSTITAITTTASTTTASTTTVSQSIRIDGGWGQWGAWASCTTTCGLGTQSRKRSCDSPYPLNGGSFCSGSQYENRICNFDVNCSTQPTSTTSTTSTIVTTKTTFKSSGSPKLSNLIFF